MIVKNVPYKPLSDYEFLDQKRKRKVQEMKKLIHKFDIKTDELGLQLSGLWNVSQNSTHSEKSELISPANDSWL